MTTLQARVVLALEAELVHPLDLGRAQYAISYAPASDLPGGASVNQTNLIFREERTLGPSSNYDLDLNAALDPLGNSISFLKVKALVIVAGADNVSDVVVGGAPANSAASFFGASADTVKVKPGGMLVLVAPDANGYGLAADTADLLRFANSAAGAAVSYTVIVVGVDENPTAFTPAASFEDQRNSFNFTLFL